MEKFLNEKKDDALKKKKVPTDIKMGGIPSSTYGNGLGENQPKKGKPPTCNRGGGDCYHLKKKIEEATRNQMLLPYDEKGSRTEWRS